MSLEGLFGPEKQRKGDVYYLDSYVQSWRYMRLGPRGTELRLKQQVIMNARKRLDDLAPGSTHVALHLRITDASGPKFFYNFPGPKYFQGQYHYPELVKSMDQLAGQTTLCCCFLPILFTSQTQTDLLPLLSPSQAISPPPSISLSRSPPPLTLLFPPSLPPILLIAFCVRFWIGLSRPV